MIDTIKVKEIINYHNKSKHTPYGLAPGPGFMDWSNEPAPERTFVGSKVIELPFIDTENSLKFKDLNSIITNRNDNHIGLSQIGSILELSMGLSAWKSYGENKWALRMNPSSGNLHPTECYILTPSLKGTNGVSTLSHYNPYNHSLEVRHEFTKDFFDGKGFIIILSSIYWREAWKYGMRAFRYCNHDIGHAIGTLSYSARLQNLNLELLHTLSNKDLNLLSGLGRTKFAKDEEEFPDCVLYCGSDSSKDSLISIIKELEDAQLNGIPNQLSENHIVWEDIYSAIKTTEEHNPLKENPVIELIEDIKYDGQDISAEKIIRKRRSAQHFDGKTIISKDSFYSILNSTVTKSNSAPFNTINSISPSHLVIFVHRVKGLDKGLYILLRNSEDTEVLKSSFSKDFTWEKIKETPATLKLYLLHKEDLKDAAQAISCSQDIAKDSAFSLAMVAKFEENLNQYGASYYKKLYWEAGLTGQALYLSAEAHGLRATGIGCYYDDVMHDLLGLKDLSFQSIYHFTIGTPVEDTRITTLTPYYHLKRSDK